MSQIADVMRRANVFVDGGSYIGKAVYQSPELSFKTETDETNFLGEEQIVGVDPLSTEVTFSEYAPEALKLANIVNGATVPFIFRGSYETSAGRKVSYKEEIEGRITKLTPGEKKVGKAETKITVSIAKWKLFNNGELVYHIDQDHFIVDNNDQMKEHIANAGG